MSNLIDVTVGNQIYTVDDSDVFAKRREIYTNEGVVYSYRTDIGMLQEANPTGGNHLRVILLDTDRLVKANDLKPVTNPITFAKNNIPTPDGILSNEIFGITMYDRMNTCAYIDLGEWFLAPLVYKVWSKLDKNIIACVNETKNFIVDDKGVLKEDENGKTGIKFLKDNFTRINIGRTTSLKRDMNVDFIEALQKDPTGVFIRKQIVIPAALRDVDTSKGGRVSLGEINEIYRNLILATKALKESADYGLDMTGATRGRVQMTLIQIYDYFGMGTTINGSTTGPNIPGKIGVMRRSVMSKTTDYASRAVIGAPELKVDSLEEMAADLDYSSVPLAHIIANFTPFMVFACKRYFENAFSGGKGIPYKDKDGNDILLYPKNYQMQFSEDQIKKEMDRFRHGYSNRLIPIHVETTNADYPIISLRFKGFQTTKEEYDKHAGNMPISERTFTWCDLFYICANEVVEDKHVVICRYPFDSIYNQFPSKVHVASTNETEPMIVDGKFFPRYPKIREEYIGQNTSSLFIDSLNLCNLYLEGMKGDYDGDTTTIKPIYTVEANEELEKAMKTKYNFINMGGSPIRVPGNEAIISIFALTRHLNDAPKAEEPVFGKPPKGT